MKSLRSSNAELARSFPSFSLETRTFSFPTGILWISEKGAYVHSRTADTRCKPAHVGAALVCAIAPAPAHKKSNETKERGRRIRPSPQSKFPARLSHRLPTCIFQTRPYRHQMIKISPDQSQNARLTERECKSLSASPEPRVPHP